MENKISDFLYPTPTPDGGLYWGPLISGILVRRYKRFLADVLLPDGSAITAHTANTGAMLGCSEPGRRVWLSRHDTPGRKYPYSWELIEMPSGLVGINTGVPNKLVKTAILAGKIPELPMPDSLRSEVVRGDSRLDLGLEYGSGGETVIEVKNCTLAENGVAYFPDAVTARGSKHLRELARLAGEGARAVIFVLVQRRDAESFAPARHIDPVWAETLGEAVAAGVELLAYRAAITLEKIVVEKRLPWDKHA